MSTRKYLDDEESIQGDSRGAWELGQESLHIAESIGNRMADQVKAWLEALPAEHQ